MKTRSYLSIFTMAVTLMTLFLLAACQPAAALGTSTTNADANRWVAMGDYYSVLSGERSASTEAANQSRWEAMGDFYLVYAGGRPLSAAQTDQSRWTALGEYYSQPSISNALSKSIG